MSGSFRPQILDGRAAAAHQVAIGKVTPGTCLNVVWRSLGSPRSDGLHGGYEWATDALARARELGAIRGTNLDDAPDGAVLYWTNVMGWWTRKGKRVWGDAGHIAFKAAGNRISTIDLPVRGRTGLVTVAEFRKAWPWLRFEGWADGPGAFLGHEVTSARGDIPVTPPVPKTISGDTKMYAIHNKATGDRFTVGAGRAQHHDNAADADLLAAVTSTLDETHQLDGVQTGMLFHTLGIPTRYADAKILRAEHPSGHWSAAGEILAALGR